MSTTEMHSSFGGAGEKSGENERDQEGEEREESEGDERRGHAARSDGRTLVRSWGESLGLG